jgi:hypothetical protein
LPVRRFNALRVREYTQTPKARTARYFGRYGDAIISGKNKSPFPGFYAFDPRRGISSTVAKCSDAIVTPCFFQSSAYRFKRRAAFPIFSYRWPVSDPQ